MQSWQPDSWQSKSCAQQVSYSNRDELNAILSEISLLPPLITPLEIEVLKKQLAEAASGQRFLLQGGDCAESFASCTANNITNKLKILLQMSLILIYGSNKPVIRVGRIAGQYAKPRSTEIETIDDITLLSYRGDLINESLFTNESRQPDPKRLLQGYTYAALSINYIRALVDGGFADLQHPEYWNLDFVQHALLAKEYQHIVNDIHNSLNFLKTIAGLRSGNLSRIDFYTSHVALHLLYEQAVTRPCQNGGWYNSSTHFPWVGMRTASLDSAHIEYLRGIANPIAVKIGPGMTSECLIGLIELLNPNNEAGRLTLIHRFGAKDIQVLLPPLIAAVRSTGKIVLWTCDPMHGNTITTSEGYKTRNFNDILHELEQAFQIHRQVGSHLGGVHFELTGENVTECIGGARGLTTADLQQAYKTLVDPRLNYEQALEMAMLIVRANQ